MEIQLLRHATLVVLFAGRRLLVDPMLSAAGAMDPVTHKHRDHWDARAVELLPRELPVLCQPPDATVFSVAGFADVRPVDATLEWGGLTLQRTGGRHGTGEVGARMGAVSGFVLRAAAEPTLYIAGDTV